MVIQTAAPAPPAVQAAVAPAPPAVHHRPRRRFTVAEYEQMAAAGILHEDERIELIDGEIVEMNPIGTAHAACVTRLNRLLNRLAGDAALVAVQNPIVLGGRTEPQPDLSVLRPRADTYAMAHPTPADILLVIEVADSSLAYDRGEKLTLYACFEVAEVWVVDLGGEQIERYTDPRDDAYRHVEVFERGETIVSGRLPTLIVGVDEVLGPQASQPPPPAGA
ncbi:MAG: Uma2 family endonuclease [Chloroflexi bacterium]|nr:Uma2 family endonuclease [Chloroflexota bacterium]